VYLSFFFSNYPLCYKIGLIYSLNRAILLYYLISFFSRRTSWIMR